MSDEAFVVGYEPCNDHPKRPCQPCRQRKPRYLDRSGDEPLPPELSPAGIVAGASLAGRERLAADLRDARAEGTFGIHVITVTTPGLYRKGSAPLDQ